MIGNCQLLSYENLIVSVIAAYQKALNRFFSNVDSTEGIKPYTKICVLFVIHTLVLIFWIIKFCLEYGGNNSTNNGKQKLIMTKTKKNKHVIKHRKERNVISNNEKIKINVKKGPQL